MKPEHLDGLPRSELEELESTAINSPSTGKKRKTSNLETGKYPSLTYST